MSHRLCHCRYFLEKSARTQTVMDANINRSPSAYLNNPAAERARYQFDQDKDLSLLRFDDASGKARGFLSFFAVHGTSIYEVRVNLFGA